MKKVRMLLRVSSNQQLEADGDLSIQRDIVKDYISKQENWELDSKEYFEGGVSGYKNSVINRDALQEALIDAQKHDYDILVCYKDDRIGRRMWEIGAYVMQLKSYGVDIYTTKDGCISPDNDDIMGQMMLALRYGNAQKSSSDTGQRVKDTAQKLVKQGRFIGGKAPYGYKLVLSGEISKHGRALHKLQIVPEQAEAVIYIYSLSYDKEYGSTKIASILNSKKNKYTPPNTEWKAGTITSILTNPVYCGRTAYKRRERTNGTYRRIGAEDWIYSDEINKDIAIIDIETWNKVQIKRNNRAIRYKEGALKTKNVNVITRNDGMLSLIDVAYCGYCGAKLTNGSKYNYWTIKATGEKRASKIPIYKCPTAWSGITHEKTKQYKADEIEEIVFKYMMQYISKLQDKNDTMKQIINNNEKEVLNVKKSIAKCEQEIKKIIEDISIMKSHIPEAMTGSYALSVEIISDTIEMFENNKKEKEEELRILQEKYENMRLNEKDISNFYKDIPSWQEIFNGTDKATKRVLVNKIVDKIIIKDDSINIKFKINLEDIEPRMSSNDSTTPYLLIRYYKNIILNDLQIPYKS